MHGLKTRATTTLACFTTPFRGETCSREMNANPIVVPAAMYIATSRATRRETAAANQIALTDSWSIRTRAIWPRSAPSRTMPRTFSNASTSRLIQSFEANPAQDRVEQHRLSHGRVE